MKRLPGFLLTVALSLGLALPAFADLMSLGEALMWEVERKLPLILVIVVLIVTALLVRHFTKRK